MSLDSVDRSLLEIMQRDARTPLDVIAHELGLSVASVGRRLARLRREGVIEKEVAILNPAEVGLKMTFIVQLELVRESRLDLDSLRHSFAAEPMVQDYFYVTGDTDFILIVRTANMEQFDALSQRLFTDNENVRKFRTSVCLRTEAPRSRLTTTREEEI